MKCSGTSGPRFSTQPVAQRRDLRGRVVLARDEQGRDLEPDVRLVLEVDQRVEHRLEPGRAEPLVEALGERLQVDVGRVHVREELAPRLLADVAGGDGDVLDAPLAAGLGDVDRVLEEDHRVVVGVGHRAAAGPHRRLGDLLGRGLGLEAVESARLRDVPVLAELAGQVAAGRAEGEHRRAGQEVRERLLLDRVDAEARGAAVGGEDDPVALPGAHEAQAALALVQLAQARADVALDAARRRAGASSGPAWPVMTSSLVWSSMAGPVLGERGRLRSEARVSSVRPGGGRAVLPGEAGALRDAVDRLLGEVPPRRSGRSCRGR